MMNIMKINGYKAIIKYDPTIDQFRGEFIGLNGGQIFMQQPLNNSKKKVRPHSKCSLKYVKRKV